MSANVEGKVAFVMWWLVGGAVLAGVVFLALSVMSLLNRLRPLERAQRRLRIRTSQAQALQLKVQAIQERVDELRAQAERATNTAQQMRADVSGWRQ